MTDKLLDAIRRGDADAVAAQLDAEPSLVMAASGPTSPILLAVYHGRADIAGLFTARGAALSFAEAIALGDAERVRELLQDDPSLVARRTPDGFAPAALAIFFRHPELARELIERGADVSLAADNPQKVAPLHAAAAVADAASMRLLLERGADPNARQQGGYTPLHGSASRGDLESAKILLEHGADREAKNDDGKTAVDVAYERGHPDFANWLRNLTP